jgi:hypothetical protein
MVQKLLRKYSTWIYRGKLKLIAIIKRKWTRLGSTRCWLVQSNTRLSVCQNEHSDACLPERARALWWPTQQPFWFSSPVSLPFHLTCMGAPPLYSTPADADRLLHRRSPAWWNQERSCKEHRGATLPAVKRTSREADAPGSCPIEPRAPELDGGGHGWEAALGQSAGK